ncbi:MAG: DarT ssDNA thymidine ADP-ribosyltransferase family protein [Terriglobales bacterium]
MNEKIKAEVERRGITRLCHFTPSRNLGQILSGTFGVLATKNLEEDERHIFAPTDLQRLDGHKDHISCSIEYPNAWYFEKARAKEILFRDWVILFIDRKYLWKDGTRFCPRNAAAAFGRDVRSGHLAFENLFAPRIAGAHNRNYVRTALTPDYCVTDEQAEVLIPDMIALEDTLGLAVYSVEQARNEIVRLLYLQTPEVTVRGLRVVIAPDLYDKYKLSRMLKTGQRPEETPFDSSTVK